MGEKKTKALEEQKKNIDRLVEERFREMVIKNANDRRKGTFLEIKSGMDKRAEAKAKAEAEAKAAEDKRLAELGSDDERSLDSNGLPKKHIPKLTKLKIEGDELETKKLEEKKKAREIKMLIQKEMDEIAVKA